MQLNYDFHDLSKHDNFDFDSLPSEAMSFFWDSKKQYVYLENLIPGYQTLQVTGREMLAYKISEETPPGMDGTLLESANLPARDIEVKYFLQSDDAHDLQAKYNKLMYFLSNQDLSFNFKDEPDYFYSGILTDIDKVEGGQLEVVSSFTLHCPNPFKVSSIKTITVNNNENIKDHYLIYSVVPESISFNLTGADFKFINQTQNQSFGLTIAHNNVVLTPQQGSVTANGGLILNDITMFSELEKLTIKNGDLIQITNGSTATIKYRRCLL